MQLSTFTTTAAGGMSEIRFEGDTHQQVPNARVRKDSLDF